MWSLLVGGGNDDDDDDDDNDDDDDDGKVFGLDALFPRPTQKQAHSRNHTAHHQKTFILRHGSKT